MQKESLSIEELIKRAEEKGVKLNPAYLAKLSSEEVENLARRVLGETVQVARKEQPSKKLNTGEDIPSFEKEPASKKARKTRAIPIKNPFGIPIYKENGEKMVQRDMLKWATEHVDLITSNEFKKWTETPEGRKFIRTSGYEAPIAEIKELAVKFKARAIKANREINEKAGRPGTKLNLKARKLSDLARQAKKLEEQKQYLEKKEAEMPGFMKIRKEALERMKKARERYRRKK